MNWTMEAIVITASPEGLPVKGLIHYETAADTLGAFLKEAAEFFKDDVATIAGIVPGSQKNVL